MSEIHSQVLPDGYRLQDYRVDRVLGEGGFGVTYLATDVVLGKQLAIKEYLPFEFAVRGGDFSVTARSEASRDVFAWGLERFLDEARRLVPFQDHPNIVRVERFFEAHGTAYMVMAFQDGGSFDVLLRREGPLDEARLRAILEPLLTGLEAVHRADLLHRDIKPDNIFIRGDGSPMLLDFGAARESLGQRSRSMTGIIAEGYSPLEQYSAEGGKQGPFTDLYALGAALYRAITGERPPPATDRVIGDTMVPISEVAAGKYDPALLAAIDATLAVMPEQRPQSIAEFRTAAAPTGAPPKPQSEPLILTEIVAPEEPSSDVQAVTPAPSDDRIKRCPACHRETYATLAVCPHCGHSFPGPSVAAAAIDVSGADGHQPGAEPANALQHDAQAVTPAASDDRIKRCPACHRETYATLAVCPHCGHSFPGPSVAAAAVDVSGAVGHQPGAEPANALQHGAQAEAGPTANTVTVGALFKGTYGLVWRNFGQLAKRGILPFVAMNAAIWILVLLSDSEAREIVEYSTITVIVIFFIQFTVAWHRVLILGPDAAGGAFGIRFGLRESKFFVFVAFVSVSLWLAVKPFAMFYQRSEERADIALTLTIVVVLFYLFARCALALPLIASDRKPAIALAWTLSRGMVWRMSLALTLVFLPLVLVILIGFAIMIAIAVSIEAVIGKGDWMFYLFLAFHRHSDSSLLSYPSFLKPSSH